MYPRLLLLLFTFFVTNTFAQQRPHYTQYIINNYILNPAVAGIENYWDVKASHRHQWVGLDGAPVTTYITFQGPLKKSEFERETANSFHPSGENPRGSAYWRDYGATDPHAGVGFTLLNDRTGPLNRLTVSGTYAYHLPIGRSTNLAAGISVGAQNVSLNTSKLYFGEDYPVDPAVGASGKINNWKPDISAGLWLYSANYFAGIAAQNIVPNGIDFANDTVKLQSGRLVPHLFATLGYRFLISDDFNFLPSVMLKYVQPAPIGFDINAKLQYEDFLWFGASYRYKDGFAGMAGINISSTFNVGYSYDVATSSLRRVSNGSHEIVIGFLIGNQYGDMCPRNVW